MAKKVIINWLRKPEAHDYPAALSYLLLLYDERTADRHVKKLKGAPILQFKAKDIFRASKLSLLGISNSHVRTDKRKIKAGQKISPLLLIRDSRGGRVIIADGYHRLCAVYSFDEDALIPCKMRSRSERYGFHCTEVPSAGSVMQSVFLRSTFPASS